MNIRSQELAIGPSVLLRYAAGRRDMPPGAASRRESSPHAVKVGDFPTTKLGCLSGDNPADSPEPAISLRSEILLNSESRTFNRKSQLRGGRQVRRPPRCGIRRGSPRSRQSWRVAGAQRPKSPVRASPTAAPGRPRPPPAAPGLATPLRPAARPRESIPDHRNPHRRGGLTRTRSGESHFVTTDERATQLIHAPQPLQSP